MAKCSFDPTIYANQPIGMFHCPECGEMVLAGIPHPDYQEPIEDIPSELTSQNLVICTQCQDKPGEWRRQNTAYVDDLNNWSFLCELCQEDSDAYWDEKWKDYYSGLM